MRINTIIKVLFWGSLCIGCGSEPISNQGVTFAITDKDNSQTSKVHCPVIAESGRVDCSEIEAEMIDCSDNRDYKITCIYDDQSQSYTCDCLIDEIVTSSFSSSELPCPINRSFSPYLHGCGWQQF